MEYQHQLQFFQQPQHSSGQFQQQHQAASFYLSTPQPHQVNSNFSGQGPPVNQNQQHMQYSQGQSAQPTGTNTHYSLQSQHEQRSQFLPYGLTSNSVVSNSYAQPPGTSMPYAFNNVQGYFGPPTSAPVAGGGVAPLPYGHGPLMPQQPQPMGRNPPNNSIRRGGEANSSSNRSAATNKHNNGNNSSKAEDTSSKNYQNLFVTKIPRDVTDGSLLTIFKPYGALSAKVMVDAATGYSKGFGFVVFPSEQQGKWVHEQFNKRPITVSEETVLAVPPGDRPPRHVYEFTMFPSHHDSGSAAKESTSLYIRNVPRGWDVARVVELLRLYGDPIYYAMRDDRLGNPVWVVYVEYDCLTCSRNALKHIHGLRTGLGQPPILAKFADNAEVRKFRRDKRMSAQQTNKSPQMGGGGGARQERDDDVVNSHEGELTNEGRVSRHHHHHSALTPTGEEEKEEGEGNGVTRSETNKPNVVVEPTAEANKDAGAEAEAKALLAHSVVQPNNNAPANSESESEKATPSTPHGVESNVGHGNKVESPEEGDAQLPSEINGPHIPDDRHAADAKLRHSMTMPSAGDSVSCMKLGNKKSSQSAASNSKREHPVPLSHFFDSHIAFDAQGNPLPHILEEAASVRVEAALAAAQGAPTAATVPATTVPVHLPSLATPPVNVLAPAGFAVPSSAQFSSPSHVVSVTNFSDMDKDSGGQQQRAPPSYSTSTYPMTSHCQGHAHQFGAPTSGQQEFVGFDGARLGVLPTTAASYPTNPQGVIFGAHQHHHHQQQQQVYHVTQRDPVPMVNPNVPSAYASTAMGGGIFVNNAGGGAQTSNFYDNNGYGHNTTNNNYSSAASSMGSHVGSSLGGAATASSQGIAYGGAMMNGMVTSGGSGHHFGALTSLQTSSSPIASSTLSQHQRQQQQEVYFPAHLASAAAALVAGGRGGAGGHYGSAVAGPQGGPMLTSAAILNNNSNSDANNGVIYNNQNINGHTLSNTNSSPNNMAGMGHGSGFGPLFVRGEGDSSCVHSSNGSASSNSQTRGGVGDRTVAASLSLAVSSTGVSYPSSSAPVGLVSFQQHQQQHGVYVMALQQLNNTANNNNNNNSMSIHSQQQQQQHYQPSSNLAYHQSSSFAHNPNPPPPHLNEGGVFLQQQQHQQQQPRRFVQPFSAPVEAMSASDSSTTSHNVITQYNAGRRLEGGGGGVAADDGSVANFSSSLVGTAGTVGSSGEQLGTANSFVSGFGGNAAATAVTAVSAAPLSPSTGADSAAGADDENKHAHHSPIDMAQW